MSATTGATPDAPIRQLAAVTTRTYPSRAAALADIAPLATTVNTIELRGYANEGDCRTHRYVRLNYTPAAAPWRFQRLDGSWWELNELQIEPGFFGALPGYTWTTGTINAGSNQLTLGSTAVDGSPFVPPQQGQLITVLGALGLSNIMAGVGVLNTSVSAVAGSVVTLAAPATTTVTAANSSNYNYVGYYYDSTAAFNGCSAYMAYRRYGRIRVPAGYWFINGEWSVDSTLWLGVQIDGDGPDATVIVQHSQTTLSNFVADASASRSVAVVGRGGGFGGSLTIRDLSFWGRGVCTPCWAVETWQTSNTRLLNVNIQGFANAAVRPHAERLFIENCRLQYNRQALVTAMGQALNETYIINANWPANGQTSDPLFNIANGSYSYDENAVNGVMPAAGSALIQSHRAIIQLSNCVNFRMLGGSVKGLGGTLAGLKTNGGENITISSVYFEGFNQPGDNPSYVNRGRVETTTLASAIGAGDLTCTATSAAWFTDQYSTQARLNTFAPSTSALATYYTIYPPDYVAGSSTTSSLGGGVTQGSYEIVSVRGWVGNAGTLVSRGQLGTTAIAWPAGAKLAESYWSAANTLQAGDAVVFDSCHMEALAVGLGSYTLTSNPATGLTNGEVVIGLAQDVFHNPQTISNSGGYIKFVGNTRMRGGVIQCLAASTVLADSDLTTTTNGTTQTLAQLSGVVTAAPYSGYTTPVTIEGKNGQHLTQGANSIAAGFRDGVLAPGDGQGPAPGRTFNRRFFFTDEAAVGTLSIDHRGHPFTGYRNPGSNTYYYSFGQTGTYYGINLLWGSAFATGASDTSYVTGSPASQVTAVAGSTFRRGDGGVGASFYIKDGGGSTASNTGWFAAQTINSGSTANRPTTPPVGYRYFDTSLGANGGKPVWYTGVGTSGWVDATGATA